MAKFKPILVGTIPINIDTEKSDLDIICCWANKSEFISTLKTSFCNEVDFSVSEKIKNNREVVVAKFMLEEFPVEVYGQNLPTTEQNGYRHMVIEHKLLVEKGEEFRQQVVNLKKQGYKTEPAFAKLLGLNSDNPFDELLNMIIRKHTNSSCFIHHTLTGSLNSVRYSSAFKDLSESPDLKESV